MSHPEGPDPDERSARHPADDAEMPQPWLRLMGVASIGLGTGLYSAAAPIEVQVVSFAPAVAALLVIAIASMRGDPDGVPAETEERDRRSPRR